MRFRDTMALVGARLKTRKVRTFTTVFVASVLFGVVLTVLVLVEGMLQTGERMSQERYGEKIVATMYQRIPEESEQITARAIELYEESDDPEKEYPLTEETVDPLDGYVNEAQVRWDNAFIKQAQKELAGKSGEQAKELAAKKASIYGGEVVGVMGMWSVTEGALTVPDLMPDDDEETRFQPGTQAWVAEGGVLDGLVRKKEKRDDAIQVLMKIDWAARALGIDVLGPTKNQPGEKMAKFLEEVNEKAIGHEVIGTVKNGENTREITFEIVGLLPARSVSTLPRLKADELDNPLYSLVRDWQGGHTANDMLMIVVNPESKAFQETYQNRTGAGSGQYNVIVTFDDAKTVYEAGRHDMNFYIQEFLDMRVHIVGNRESVKQLIQFFFIMFTIISMIIMAGTLGRVADDEKASIALYRTVGATNGDILKIFAAYVVVLGGLIIAAATIIMLVAVGVISLMYSGLLTPNMAAAFNLTGVTPVFFAGWDWRILGVYAAVLGMSLFCLVFIFGKLFSTELIRDLKA